MIDFTLDEAIAVFDTQTTIVFLITLCSFFIPVLLLFPPVPIRISEALAQTHTKLGLEPGTTNLPTPPTTGKQPAEATAKDAAKDKSSLAKIQSLFIYPIKSCQGIELQKAKVFGSGLQYDRLYTFARLKDASAATGAGPSDAAKEGEGGEDAGPVWDFVTQRQFPRLAKVGVDIWCPDAVKTRGKLTERGSDETFMIVRFPWSRPGFLGIVDHVAARFSKGWSGYPEKEILLPVSFPSEPEIAGRGYRYEKVRVWREVMTALNMEEELPRDLAEYLGINERLGIFRTSPMMSREVHRNAPNADEAGYQPTVRFQDSYPIHLMNIASVEDMATKIEDPTLKDLSVRRFRANVVITGPPAYDEDHWKTFRLKQGTASVHSECTYHVSCRTSRCKLPNVDPATAIPHPVEPDRYLRKHRNIDDGCPKNGCLGMMLTPLFSDQSRRVALESWLEVGMEIDVTERGEHLFVR